MQLPPSLAVVLLAIRVTTDAIAEDLPYLPTQSPLTLVSSNDGEFAQTFLKKPDEYVNRHAFAINIQILQAREGLKHTNADVVLRSRSDLFIHNKDII